MTTLSTHNKDRRKATWRVFRKLRDTSYYLGIVEAPTHVGALETAIRQFDLPITDRDKLVAEPRD